MIALKLLSPHHLYLVALSGGADSVALALMMIQEGLRVHALHCNFHLRGQESDRDEAFVTRFCQEHGIPLEIKHFDTITLAREHGNSLEMEARQLRYDWFRQRALDLHAEAICVAHHMDDQAETLLLNLIRGTGLQGLAAMHPERTIQGLKIIRPLLNISKQDILDFLHSRGQEYVTDSTNLERDALRNKIRLDLMPMLRQLNPSITQCLARTAENVRLELATDSSESHLHRWLAPLGFTRQQILDIHSHTQAPAIEHSGLAGDSPAHGLGSSDTLHRPLVSSPSTEDSGLGSSDILSCPLVSSPTPEDSGLGSSDILSRPLSSSPSQPPLSGLLWHSASHTLLLDRGQLVLRPRQEAPSALPQLIAETISAYPQREDFLNKQQAFINAQLLQGPLLLRRAQTGDRFRPYGMKYGSKLLSDFLTNRKVNLLDKQSQLVVIDSTTNQIIWVVGQEIDHRYRIDETTPEILRLTVGE